MCGRPLSELRLDLFKHRLIVYKTVHIYAIDSITNVSVALYQSGIGLIKGGIIAVTERDEGV
jgi:hypothetical protein